MFLDAYNHASRHMSSTISPTRLISPKLYSVLVQPSRRRKGKITDLFMLFSFYMFPIYILKSTNRMISQY